MKKSVYTCQVVGRGFNMDLEILLDINRELTDNDNSNLRECAENIKKALHEESIHIDPESKIFADKEKSEIISLFGDSVIYIEEIPNGYCTDYCCKHLPWFIITTSKGRIKIGWRKRVIYIDWSDTIIKENADIIFPYEDVTKFDKVIHAWGCDKAKEYLNLLLS